MKKAIFYHAGCPVCVDAESAIVTALDKSRFQVEVVHLGETKTRISEARHAGVQSVPALVLDNQCLHLNFGAKLEDLEG